MAGKRKRAANATMRSRLVSVTAFGLTIRPPLPSAVAGTMAAWPLAARGQQLSGKISRIGILGSRGTVVQDTGYAAFIAELRKLGFTEGRNLVVEYHPTDEGRDVAFAAAAEMVRSKVAVIVAAGAEFNLQAALSVSPTIPIVFTAVSYDPIARGYVPSLARPGDNITGIFHREPDLARKRVELMREACPGEDAAGSFLGCDHIGRGGRVSLAGRWMR